MSAPSAGREQDRPQQHLSRPKHHRKGTRRSQHGGLGTQDTLGQFSFAPTTQTTVVTTTTTTTTKFPPFLMRAPRRTSQLDPKLYPLAAIPTPPTLKSIRFTHQGRHAIFHEAPDTSIALEGVRSPISRLVQVLTDVDQIHEEQEYLRKGNGIVQCVEHTEPYYGRDNSENQRSTSKSLSDTPASPSSIVDTDISSSESYVRRLPQVIRKDRQAMVVGQYHRSQRLREIQNNEPITPEMQGKQPQRVRRRPEYYVERVTDNTPDVLLPSPDTEQQVTNTMEVDDEFRNIVRRRSTSRALASRASHDTVVPTPPVEPEDIPTLVRPLTDRALSSIPSRLHVADSPLTQDGNLPSPSLSPVTAAAQAQNSGYFTDQESNSDIASYTTRSVRPKDQSFDEIPSDARYGSPAATDPGDSDVSWHDLSQPSDLSITDFPAMFDYFESLPDELKSYVMHQLLRRCPKSTLHVVADAVNPALKCDFLSILPPELALNVLSHLDVKSLCKAAQVSRKWRQMVNSDEKAWKELFDADGFTLPDGELQRAITQGWGWQNPYGVNGSEYDLSTQSPVKVESEAESVSTTSSSRKLNLAAVRRSKRKAAAALLSSRNKQIKRQDVSRETSVDIDSIDWMAQMSTAEGPYNAANAAILAVPNPKLPVPSLKGLHLYKSLYRRHHLIRRNWMSDDTKPRHIAFRAHDSHVVTCLQFDTDKILTGSDDNNINVYDTKTGALRQLLKGHEGGVWALQYEGNVLVSGSTDRSVRVWDIERGDETHVFRGHTSTVRCLQILMPTKVGETAEGKPIMMPRQPLIITGSRDSTLRVWKLPRSGDEPFIQEESDVESDDCPYFVRTLTGHQHSVRAIAAHADTLVSGSYDCTVRVWKISTGETIHRLQGHSQKVYSVVLDHARNRCISGSMDNLVKIWSLNTGAPLYTLEGHTSLVGLLDLNNDRLVSAAADSTLRIWDPENGQCKATLTAHTGAITCFQHDGQKVISGSDRTLKMWDIKTGECMKDLLSDLSGVWQVKFNDRRCVAAVQRDQMTYIEVLDFGASRDAVPEDQRGRRIVVDELGRETSRDGDSQAAFDEERNEA